MKIQRECAESSTKSTEGAATPANDGWGDPVESWGDPVEIVGKTEHVNPVSKPKRSIEKDENVPKM